MADKPWKAFERDIARLFAGHRYPANTGADIDVEGPTVLVECKLRRAMSLNELAEAAEHMARRAQGTLKTGIVAVKPRRGKGRRSPILVVMTAEEWARMHGAPALHNE